MITERDVTFPDVSRDCIAQTYYTLVMSTITFRASPEVDEALSELVAETQQDRSAAIRAAILESWRAHRAARLQAEAAALAADPEDRAEIQAVRDDLDDLRAW